jgi:Immunity protein 26
MGRNRTAREPGTFIAAPLGDGTFGYARLLQPPDVAFYRLRTAAEESDLDKIATSSVAFIVTANVDKWKVIGWRDLDGELLKPVVTFMQDLADYRRCTIYDTAGNVTTATPEECEGLERSAAWEDHHVRQRLLDMFEGRKNEVVEHLRVRRG